jgi:hypothetical protein
VRNETVQRDAERALASPRRSHHHDELTFGYLKVHPVQRGLLLPPVTVSEALNLYRCPHYLAFSSILKE